MGPIFANKDGLHGMDPQFMPFKTDPFSATTMSTIGYGHYHRLSWYCVNERMYICMGAT